MSKRTILFIVIAWLIGVADYSYGQTAPADSLQTDSSTVTSAAADSLNADDEEDTEKDKYAQIVEEAETSDEGLFNIYYKDEKLYFEVPFGLLEKDMLLSSTISKISDNKMGTVGAKPHNPQRLQFSRVDSVLLLRKVQKQAMAAEGNSSIKDALRKNNIGPIVKIFDIEAYNEDRSAAVIDVTDYFMSDIDDLSPFGPLSMNISPTYKHRKKYQKSRSFVETFKSFDDNLSIKSHLSYEYTLTNARGQVVEKDTPFTAVMTRTLLLLPEEPVRPRIADPRVGMFVTGKQEFSADADRSKPAYFARRFHLEPKDPEAYFNGELTEPKEPITFYVDSDFPADWLPTIKEAVIDWNKTFEEIGFKNAVRALDYPEDDPEFDPDNLKYNVIRYSPIPVQNAMGPSWIDPRSGEILNASVYVYHDIVRLINNWRFVQTAPADEKVRQVKLPRDYKLDGLRYVIRHEVGHTLGFMHNMAGSSSIPVDSLRSPSFTQKHGTTYSIMDYARYNYVAQPGDAKRGVKLSPPEFGIYDYYMVDWAYRYYPNGWSKEEVDEKLKALVDSKAGDIRFRYGRQQGFAMDPSSLTEDLGDNAVKASKLGIKNLKYVMNNLNDWVGEEDSDYSYRLSIWNGVLMQYVRYINHLYANVGGIYLNQKYEGDPRPIYDVVPEEKQKQTLKFLLAQIKDLDWIENQEVMKNMPLMGTPEQLLREEVTKAVLSAPLKVNLGAQKATVSNAYTPEEAMEDIYNVVWGKTRENLSLTKKDKYLQKIHLETLIEGSGLSAGQGGGAAAFAGNDPAAGSAVPGVSLENGSPHSALAAITGYDPVEVPDFVREYGINEFGYGLYKQYLSGRPAPEVRALDRSSTSATFGSTRVHFNLRPSLESLNYRYITKLQELLEEAAEQATDTATEIHYELLLHKIEKTIS